MVERYKSNDQESSTWLEKIAAPIVNIIIEWYNLLTTGNKEGSKRTRA